nr:PAS domain-containing protein [uncultured Dongia sp.]
MGKDPDRSPDRSTGRSTGWDALDAFRQQNRQQSKVSDAIDEAALFVSPYQRLDRSTATEDFFELINRELSPRFQSPRLRLLFSYWQDLAQDGLPAYDDVDPAALHVVLPNIMVVELSGEPLRVFYRLVGKEVIRFTGLDFVGHYLDELQMDQFNLEAIKEAYRAVRESGLAGAGMALSIVDGEPRLKTEYLICPFRGPTAVDRCLVIEDYFLNSTAEVDDLSAAKWRAVAEL